MGNSSSIPSSSSITTLDFWHLGIIRVSADDTAGAAQMVAKEILEQLQVFELLKYMGLTFLLKRSRYFDYLFYIDFEASMADPRAQFALGHLQEFAGFLHVLGYYPMDTGLL